jgi:hypothetical protein
MPTETQLIAEHSLRYEAQSWDEAPQTFRDLLLRSPVPTPGLDAVGLDISWPYYPSVLYPSVFLERVNVRGYYQTGIRLRDTWNATLTDCFINAPIISDEENADPSIMEAGIDLIGAMDCHITRPRITGAQHGIRAQSAPDGHPRSEGLRIHGGFLMHVNYGVYIQGSAFGGWVTPVASIRDLHIAFNGKHGNAIRAIGQSFLQISGVNCYASAYHRTAWAIYLIGCKNVILTDIDVWSNWATPGFLGGILLDHCENVQINSTSVSEDRYGRDETSVDIALHATQSCRNVTTNGKIWELLARQGKVANFAAG